MHDDAIRGGVQVTKADAELDESEAVGGNGHAAEGVGTTLSGIEFAITNASENKVLVGDVWYEPGEVVATVETAWDEEIGSYIAKTAPEALPYGTYTIQETATNDSYLLTDGEPKTFEIRTDGLVVTADAEGGELTFYNQVVRNDLKLSKKAEDTNASLQVPFAISNVATRRDARAGHRPQRPGLDRGGLEQAHPQHQCQRPPARGRGHRLRHDGP